MKTKLLIFGITGDLSKRKLLPALRDIIKFDKTDDLSIIGVSRRAVDVEALLTESLGDSELKEHTTVFTMNLAEPADYLKLKDYLALSENEQLLAYLSVPPTSATQIVDLMGAAGINTPNVKILFEKPFGLDLESAKEMIAQTGRYFNEGQLYRIDHYMAKEVASDIIKLRSNAENRHHHWSNQSVESVEVVASEEIGVEDRATFYEQTGALRDVVQGHLMQLLALVLMDFSGNIDNETLPSRRLTALEKLEKVDPLLATRAQYETYQEEVSNIGSQTETYVRLALKSDDVRWRGAKLSLAAGKMLAKKRTAVTVTYTDGSQDVFEEKNGKALNAYERVLLSAIRGEKGIFTSSGEVLRTWAVLDDVQRAWEFSKTPLKIYKNGENLIN
jgi:glucose-6-phosphate 1-dehydrogenase